MSKLIRKVDGDCRRSRGRDRRHGGRWLPVVLRLAADEVQLGRRQKKNSQIHENPIVLDRWCRKRRKKRGNSQNYPIPGLCHQSHVKTKWKVFLLIKAVKDENQNQFQVQVESLDKKKSKESGSWLSNVISKVEGRLSFSCSLYICIYIYMCCCFFLEPSREAIGAIDLVATWFFFLSRATPHLVGAEPQSADAGRPVTDVSIYIV